MASWRFRRQGDRLTIDITGQLSESDTATPVHDLKPRLTDDVAEVIFDGASVKAGLGPHLRRIKQVGQLVLHHGKAFSVRPV
jgi:hypothetical protein